MSGMTAPADASDQGPRTFSSAVSICFSKYATFSGRAPRSEFWYFALFSLIVGIAAVIGDIAISISAQTPVRIVDPIVDLVLLLPTLSVQVRRLHDLDRTGWCWWFGLLPVIGWIVILVWDCTRGTAGSNRFGPDPLAGQLLPGFAVT